MIYAVFLRDDYIYCSLQYDFGQRIVTADMVDQW